MDLRLQNIKIEDCILYPQDIIDAKLKWLRTEFPMFQHIKASLKKDGMINPIWVFELSNGKYKIAKGCARCIAWLDLGHTTIKALVASLGMKRKIANNLFYTSEYVEDIQMIDKTMYFPKGF